MQNSNNQTVVIVGGGAAGFFAAIACAEQSPQHRVVILEKTRQVLAKVRISGGGRCNVTHACFDPGVLVRNYPRGSKELRGPFSRFQPRQTIEWFESRGVQLKAEADGRMFPVTDHSETIIQCLQREANRLGIEIFLEHGVEQIGKGESRGFNLLLSNGKEVLSDKLLITTGSAPKIFSLIEVLGHSIVPLVPSLFTFNIPDSPFLDLSGVAVPEVEVRLPVWGLVQKGAILLTHWGISGPAVLKLSAWGAREMHGANYQTQAIINWIPEASIEEIVCTLLDRKKIGGAKQVGNDPLFLLPKQLWRRLAALAGISEGMRWAALSQKHLSQLQKYLVSTELKVSGKTTYKQEFVTCGGIDLKEVNFKTMESRVCPGLFFAGEVLNIDGITGGFNFQNAWTTGWIAGHSIPSGI